MDTDLLTAPELSFTGLVAGATDIVHIRQGSRDFLLAPDRNAGIAIIELGDGGNLSVVRTQFEFSTTSGTVCATGNVLGGSLVARVIGGETRVHYTGSALQERVVIPSPHIVEFTFSADGALTLQDRFSTLGNTLRDLVGLHLGGQEMLLPSQSNGFPTGPGDHRWFDIRDDGSLRETGFGSPPSQSPGVVETAVTIGTFGYLFRSWAEQSPLVISRINAFGRTIGEFRLGGDQNDSLRGGSGNDQITGGLGMDTLADGAGSDTMFGEAGNDRFVMTKDAVSDRIRNWAKGDVIDLRGFGDDLESADLAVSSFSAATVPILMEGERLYLTAATGSLNPDTLAASDFILT